VGSMRIGLMGAGVISDQYLRSFAKTKGVEVVMIADLDSARAEERARQFNVESFGSPDQLLAREDVELVVNLTIPKVHEEVTTNCLRAGKHVWSEKPLALDTEATARLVKVSNETGFLVGCAPDTFLGPGVQTGLRMISEGTVGELMGASTAFEVPGPESWHPNPDFLYAKGGGPIFDMGPYYITALVCGLGSIRQVVARATQAEETRVIGSGPRAGQRFPVEVPTNVYAMYDFTGGQIAQSSFSFDCARPRVGVLEFHGTEGTISIPDPNDFEGVVKVWRRGSGSFDPVETKTPEPLATRGTGVVEMAEAIRQGRKPRANIDLASHVVEVMQATEAAALSASTVAINSRTEKPDLLPANFNPLVELSQ
jgi:predicted dehydrogenase